MSWGAPVLGAGDVASRFSLALLCYAVNTGCPEPTPLFDYAWGRVLFGMLAFSNIFVALLMLAVLGGPSGAAAPSATAPSQNIEEAAGKAPWR